MHIINTERGRHTYTHTQTQIQTQIHTQILHIKCQRERHVGGQLSAMKSHSYAMGEKHMFIIQGPLRGGQRCEQEVYE